MVVPALNEEVLIEPALTSMPAFVYWVYAVDDGSTDNTLGRMREVAALIRLSEGSLRGFFEGEPDVYTDEDLKVRYLGGALVCVSSRTNVVYRDDLVVPLDCVDDPYVSYSDPVGVFHPGEFLDVVCPGWDRF